MRHGRLSQAQRGIITTLNYLRSLSTYSQSHWQAMGVGYGTLPESMLGKKKANLALLTPDLALRPYGDHLRHHVGTFTWAANLQLVAWRSGSVRPVVHPSELIKETPAHLIA